MVRFALISVGLAPAAALQESTSGHDVTLRRNLEASELDSDVSPKQVGKIAAAAAAGAGIFKAGSILHDALAVKSESPGSPGDDDNANPANPTPDAYPGCAVFGDGVVYYANCSQLLIDGNMPGFDGQDQIYWAARSSNKLMMSKNDVDSLGVCSHSQLRFVDDAADWAGNFSIIYEYNATATISRKCSYIVGGHFSADGTKYIAACFNPADGASDTPGALHLQLNSDGTAAAGEFYPTGGAWMVGDQPEYLRVHNSYFSPHKADDVLGALIVDPWQGGGAIGFGLAKWNKDDTKWETNFGDGPTVKFDGQNASTKCSFGVRSAAFDTKDTKRAYALTQYDTRNLDASWAKPLDEACVVAGRTSRVMVYDIADVPTYKKIDFYLPLIGELDSNATANTTEGGGDIWVDNGANFAASGVHDIIFATDRGISNGYIYAMFFNGDNFIMSSTVLKTDKGAARYATSFTAEDGHHYVVAVHQRVYDDVTGELVAGQEGGVSVFKNVVFSGHSEPTEIVTSTVFAEALLNSMFFMPLLPDCGDSAHCFNYDNCNDNGINVNGTKFCNLADLAENYTIGA